jgi:hypothetical protein
MTFDDNDCIICHNATDVDDRFKIKGCNCNGVYHGDCLKILNEKSKFSCPLCRRIDPLKQKKCKTFNQTYSGSSFGAYDPPFVGLFDKLLRMIEQYIINERIMIGDFTNFKCIMFILVTSAISFFVFLPYLFFAYFCYLITLVFSKLMNWNENINRQIIMWEQLEPLMTDR